MDGKDIFRKLTFGTRFDFKRFHADAEKLQIGSNISGAHSCANFNNNEIQQAAQSRMSDSRQALHNSMSILKQQLQDRSLVQQFQKLYIEKPGLTMNAAKLVTNEQKNRYSDILPYDSTRIVLTGAQDYINASHIIMTLPCGDSASSRVVGRYIGSQGPLPNTVGDFWRMVWEQQVHLLLMLTAETEGRRVKCHRYWPQHGEMPVRHGRLTVACSNEHKASSATVRHFQLTSDTETRMIRQLQYTAWPDHGVPSSCEHFLEFVRVVQQEMQKQSTESQPTLVHCSAGVGRTGVLIGMLTACSCIEAGLAVDMLAIVRQMRDQRAVLVQTPDQFVFLCQAVLSIYNDDVANDNQNNNAVTQRDTCGRAVLTDSDSDQDTDNDDDGLMDSRTSKDIIESSLKSHPSDSSKASDKSPRPKRKKSLERLTQMRQEEVNHFRNQHHIHVYGTDIPAPVATFDQLQTEYSIDATIMSNIQSMGFHTPTVIEMQAIPVMLHRRELMACAPTGSGKTLAFVIPLLHHLQRPHTGGVRALVLSPTRELAEQIVREINRVGDGLGFRVHFIRRASDDVRKRGSKLLLKFDILVTTPNRLIHLLQQDSSLSLSTVEWLVIDESDKLFEDGETGFRQQLAAVYKACDSKDVRRAMFSATFSYDVEEWCRLNLDNVVQVYVGARNTVAPTIQQELLYVGDESGKLIAIRDIVRKGFQPPMLVFVQSKDRAKDLFHELAYDGINVDVIHADRTQQQRDAVVRGFRSGSVWILICTDVMCRGMDFKGVNLVINYDFPNSDYVYIHRIGRTGRAGRPGKAITFFTDTDTVNLRCIANKMREAGCSVPDYMLQMKLPSRSMKKKLKKSAPVRDDIRTDSALTKRKKRASKRSKKPSSDKSSTSNSNLAVDGAPADHRLNSPSTVQPKTKKLKLDKNTRQ